MKIKIPLGKKNRYVDLMGDPIHQNKIASTFISQEFAGAVIFTSAASALAQDNSVKTALDFALQSSIGIIFSRLALDKVAYQFYTNSPKDICIDKTPTAEQGISSITRYGSAIRFGIFAQGAYLLYAFATLAPDFKDPAKLLDSFKYAPFIIRELRGLYRSSKLLSGEWAIVSMPDGQEKIEDAWEFEIPDFIKPPVPQPAREML